MAEFVQIRIEEMIPELEEMGRLGIFDHKEINCLIKKRKEFEYRLHRQTKRKEDILGYIQYERNLKDLIRKRRQRLGKDQKRREIEYAINERICKLFRILTIRWKSDVQVWLSFIEFCRETKQFSQASHAFVDLLACHSEDPKLWISAARFEMDDNKCPEVARKLLFRALKFHPRHQEILVEYFRLELLYLDRLRKRQKALGITVSGAASKVESASRDAVMNGELIDVAYESAVEDLMEHNELEEAARFAVGCLACCRDFEETEKIEQKIVSDLEEKFSCCPLAWDTIARRKLDKETYTRERDPPKLMQRVRNCVEVYESAVEKLGEATEMWSLYLDSLGELQNQTAAPGSDGPPLAKRARGDGKLTRFLRQQKSDVLQRAMAAGRITPKHFRELVTSLYAEGGKEEAFSALEQAAASTQLYEKDPSLWLFHLSALLDYDTNREKEVEQLFEKAIVKLMKEPELLAKCWKTLLNKKPSDALFLRALRDAAVGVEVKDQYLMWKFAKEGLDGARTLYSSAATEPPFSLAFHLSMKSIEEIGETGNSEETQKRIRKIFEIATLHFGDKSTDLWLAYMRWEDKGGDPLLAPSVYDRATKALPTFLAEEFMRRRTLEKVS